MRWRRDDRGGDGDKSRLRASRSAEATKRFRKAATAHANGELALDKRVLRPSRPLSTDQLQRELAQYGTPPKSVDLATLC